jgi:hypothetical protein
MMLSVSKPSRTRLREEAQSPKNVVLDAATKTKVSFSNPLGNVSNLNSVDAIVESLSLTDLKKQGYFPQDFF